MTIITTLITFIIVMYLTLSFPSITKLFQNPTFIIVNFLLGISLDLIVSVFDPTYLCSVLKTNCKLKVFI